MQEAADDPWLRSILLLVGIKDCWDRRNGAHWLRSILLLAGIKDCWDRKNGAHSIQFIRNSFVVASRKVDSSKTVDRQGNEVNHQISHFSDSNWIMFFFSPFTCQYKWEPIQLKHFQMIWLYKSKPILSFLFGNSEILIKVNHLSKYFKNFPLPKWMHTPF